ncbi:recombinase family protein [Micromonospora sp. L32]|uniref:recombinase family protein n=1 Tax=Micromonospora TaxID=1873 RepID=UPI003F8CDFC9
MPRHRTGRAARRGGSARRGPGAANCCGRVVAYARVSSADQRDDLERQAGRVVTGATERGLSVDQVVTEVGSGMNGHRRKLTGLLSDPAVSVLVVEHRDWLIRFDVTEVLTSLCARRYGRRSAARRAAMAVAVATASEQP